MITPRRQMLLKMKAVVEARARGAKLREAAALIGATSSYAGYLERRHRRASQHPANVGRNWLNDWIEAAE